MECYQPTGSFKIRGSGTLCQKLAKEGFKHVISSSGGNAGYSTAYSGKKLGMKVTVVMPETSSQEARKKILSQDAELIIYGTSWYEAHKFSIETANKLGYAYIHPFDNPSIWEGNSTIVDELVHDSIIPDLIILSVGGGGLFAGIMHGIERNRLQNKTKVVVVETEGAPSFFNSMQQKKLITLDTINTIAVTLGCKRICEEAFKLGLSDKVMPILVSDKEACQASLQFADDYRTLTEPACGATLSIIYNQEKYKFLENYKNIVVIVCGGIGVSIKMLQEYTI